MKFIYPLGATPLNNAEAVQLIPQHITNQQELNEWEQAILLWQKSGSFLENIRIFYQLASFKTPQENV